MLFGKHINKYYKKYGVLLFVGIVTLLLVDYVSIFIPKLFSEMIDYFNAGVMTKQKLFDMIGIFIGMVGIMVLGRIMWRVFLMGSSRSVQYDMRRQLFEHALTLDQPFYQVKKVGAIMAYFSNDIEVVRHVFGRGLLMILDGLFLGIIVAIRMFKMDVKLTLLSIIPLILLGVVAFFIVRKMRLKFRVRQDAFESLNEFTQESFSGIQVIKAFVKEVKEAMLFKEKSDDFYEKHMDYVKEMIKVRIVVTIFINLTAVTILLLGSYIAITNPANFSAGNLTEFFALFSMLTWPVMALTQFASFRSQAQASYQRISEFLDSETLLTEGVEETEIKGNIRFNNLTFAYPDEPDRKVYLTSIGQSDDLSTISNLLYNSIYKKQEQDEFNKKVTVGTMINADEVEEGSIVFLIQGINEEGLETSKSSIDNEMSRALAFNERSLNDEIKVIVIHLGDKDDENTNELIKASTNSNNLIMTKEYDEEFLRSLNTEFIYLYETENELIDAFKLIFGKIDYEDDSASKTTVNIKKSKSETKPFMGKSLKVKKEDKELSKEKEEIIKNELDETFVNIAKDNNVLKDVTFEINEGESVGIIGRTGSGKTTLVDLFLRIYNVERDMLYMEDIDVMDLKIANVRNQIAYVPQDNFLYSTTISDNISFSFDHLDEAKIIESAKLADIYDNVIDFKEGFDTVLGERGVTVSGGQKQRISIARALAKEASILIFDDSVSAVDTDTEERILNNLKEIREGKTTIIIAHRISTVRNLDKIVLLEEGRVLDVGTHEELLSRTELYKDLVQRQTLERRVSGDA